MRRPTATATAAFCLLALAAAAAPASAQVPTFEEVTGHQFGERITLHHEMVRYLHRLAETSDRVTVVDQGSSWEGRELPVAIVTSPRNHARLEVIRAASARLADPRALASEGAAEDLDPLLADQPVVVWMGGSIHGFELSGAEGVLRLLERLATADDPETLEVLDRTVVLLDPMLNPDGREAFAQRNHQRLGHRPNPHPADWSNDYERWDALLFRTGHYFFDTNRDWFAQTQAETRARVPTLLAWKPQVMVDLHEMGSDAEFFFDPPAEPYGPWFPDFARSWFPRFGQAYARAFDQAGFEYMTGERYNYFYPGYTSSFGSYQGAVSMLFEQGSSRGLALERPDGTVRTLADASLQQYTAAWTTVATAARGRGELLRDFHAAHRAAVDAGRNGTRRYLLVPGEADPGLERELVALLLRDGVEVGRLTGDARLRGVTDRAGGSVDDRSFAAGTWVIEAAQPRASLVRALLEPDLPLSPEFLEEARGRVDRGENPRFYDVTAWSLPLLFDVAVFGSSDGAPLPAEPVSLETLAARPAFPPEPPGYAYLLDGRNAASMAVLHALRRQEVRASVLTRATTIGGEAVSSGTVVVRAGQRWAPVDRQELHELLRELAAAHGVAVRGVETGLGDAGAPALGTGDAVAAGRSEVAILADGPLHPYSFGWSWYVLDRRYRLPVTVLRTGAIAGTPMEQFDVLVVPDLFSPAALAAELGEAGVERLKRWVADGGTLVAVAGAVDFVREEMEMTALRSWYDEMAAPEDVLEGKAEEPARYEVPGAIVAAELDREAWLAAGAPDDELPVLVESSRVLLAPAGAPSRERRVVARYAGEAEGAARLLSGHAWPESLERLPGAVAVYEERVGRGRVIAFAEDPSFRAYWRGAERLLLNAVVLGPTAP